MKTFFLFLLGLIFVISCGNSAGKKSPVSGQLINGVRVVTLNADEDRNIRVYRGDYLRLSLPGESPFALSIPDLEISQSFPAPQGEKDYVTMRKTGSFAFQAGSIKGTITVMDFKEARYQELSASEADALIKNISPFILDVRTPEEFQAGRLFNANLLPVQSLAAQIESLAEYKEKDILIYCASGNRSTVAAQILIDNGFKKIYNLRHGISDWHRQGFPLEQ